MRENVKEILKGRPFNYDEDNFYLVDVDDYFAKIGDTSEDTVVALVRCGMNNPKGFDRKIKRSLKGVLKLRKQFLTVELVPGGKAAIRFEAQFAKTEKSAEKLVKEKEKSIKRFDYHLGKYFDVAMEEADKFAGKDAKDLKSVGSKSVLILKEIIKSRKAAIDISSTNAKEYAENIIRHIDEWKGRLAEAVEDGRIDNESYIIDPLRKALNVADDWAGEKEGISTSNPVFTEEIREYEQDKDLLHIVTELVETPDFTRLREIKSKNKENLRQICRTFNVVLADANKNRILQADREILMQLRETFAEKSRLLGTMVNPDDYISSRLCSETVLSEFLEVEKDLLDRVENAVKVSADRNNIHSRVFNILTNFVAWDRTHSTEWKTEINEEEVEEMFIFNKARVQMEARKQLQSLLTETITALTKLIKKAEYLRNSEGTSDIIGYAVRMKDFFEEMNKSVEARSYIDSKENVEATKILCDKIMAVRVDLFKDEEMGRLDDRLDEMAEIVKKMQNSSDRAKCVNVSEYQHNGKDELVAATKVMDWLDKAKLFFDKNDKDEEELMNQERPQLINPMQDPEWIKCKQAVDAVIEKSNAMSDAEYEMNEKYLEKELKAAEDALARREKAIDRENGNVQKQLDLIEAKKSYGSIVLDLKSLYDMFSSRILDVPYADRHALLVELGITDVAETYRTIQQAAMSKNMDLVKKTMLRLQGVIAELQKRTQGVDTTITDIDKINDIIKQKNEESEKEESEVAETIYGTQVKTETVSATKSKLRAARNSNNNTSGNDGVKETTTGNVDEVNTEEVKETEDPIFSVIRRTE